MSTTPISVDDELSPEELADEALATDALEIVKEYLEGQAASQPDSASKSELSDDITCSFELPALVVASAVVAVRLPTSDLEMLNRGSHLPAEKQDAIRAAIFPKLQRCEITVYPDRVRFANELRGIVCQITIPLLHAALGAAEQGTVFNVLIYQFDALFRSDLRVQAPSVRRLSQTQDVRPLIQFSYRQSQASLTLSGLDRATLELTAESPAKKAPILEPDPASERTYQVDGPGLASTLFSTGLFACAFGDTNGRMTTITIEDRRARGGTFSSMSEIEDPAVNDLRLNVRVRGLSIFRSVLRRLKSNVRVSVTDKQVILSKDVLLCGYQEPQQNFPPARPVMEKVENELGWIVSRQQLADALVMLSYVRGNSRVRLEIFDRGGGYELVLARVGDDLDRGRSYLQIRPSGDCADLSLPTSIFISGDDALKAVNSSPAHAAILKFHEQALLVVLEHEGSTARHVFSGGPAGPSDPASKLAQLRLGDDNR